MKSRLTIIITILAILIGLVFWAYYYQGIFTPYNILTAKSDLNKGKVFIVQYGELRNNELLEEKLANKYGFSYTGVGCLVTTPVINGINNYNQVVIKHLTEVNGAGWFDELQKERKENNLDW